MEKMILFDLDGTLWEASDSVSHSWNVAMEKMGLPERMTGEWMRRLMGQTMDAIAAQFLPHYSQELREQMMALCTDCENAYLAEVGGTLYPQLEETLELLSKRYALAVVSNCHCGYIEAFLQAHKLEKYFVDTECFGNTGKPKSYNIRLLLERHGNPPAIYVGDTQNDCYAAEEAGVPFVHAAYGYGTIDHVVPALSTFAELPARAEAFFGRVPFYPADILLPKGGFDKWAVIACDQFTSEPDYWVGAEQTVGDAPSALRLVFPEVYLENEPEKRIAAINQTMAAYLESDLLETYREAMIYVERTLPNGQVRHGLVGAIDLEEYSYERDKEARIRATEGWVASRIPPRVHIRENAPMELPHVLLLVDDERKTVIEPLEKAALPLLYECTLMQGGGSIRGYLVGNEQQDQILAALGTLGQDRSMLFAVGDGNHSLVTAKTCYQNHPNPLNRYSLVELVNIHDRSMEFEPIYRVVFHADVPALLAEMETAFAAGEPTDERPQEIEWISASGSGTLTVAHPTQHLPVGSLQDFLDAYVAKHPEVTVDYIHGIDSTKALAQQENAIGFLFDGMEKDDLFPAILHDGALPRKTFSIGEAQSKRYYIEGRKIR